MDGADKGLIEYRGRPLVAHVIERLAPQVDALLISANRNLDIYQAFGFPVIADDLSDFQGPLAGLRAGLAACTTPWLLSCPCDVPALPDDLAARLLAAVEMEGKSVAVAVTNAGMQPTFQLCRHEVLPVLDAFLATGNRRLGDWCREMKAIEVAFPSPETFKNLNNPSDIK